MVTKPNSASSIKKLALASQTITLSHRQLSLNHLYSNSATSLHSPYSHLHIVSTLMIVSTRTKLQTSPLQSKQLALPPLQQTSPLQSKQLTLTPLRQKIIDTRVDRKRNRVALGRVAIEGRIKSKSRVSPRRTTNAKQPESAAGRREARHGAVGLGQTASKAASTDVTAD